MLSEKLRRELAEIEASADPPLTPSWHGEECLANGEHPGIECCCDNCEHYLECFPDWEQQIDVTAKEVLERFRPAFEELAK